MRASWSSGLGACPLGYTTYAPNAVESAHKGLKHLMGGSWRQRNIGQTVLGVVAAVESRRQRGFYRGLMQAIAEPWPNLIQWPRKKSSKLLSPGEDEKAETVPWLRRISFLNAAL